MIDGRLTSISVNTSVVAGPGPGALAAPPNLFVQPDRSNPVQTSHQIHPNLVRKFRYESGLGGLGRPFEMQEKRNQRIGTVWTKMLYKVGRLTSMSVSTSVVSGPGPGALAAPLRPACALDTARPSHAASSAQAAATGRPTPRPSCAFEGWGGVGWGGGGGGGSE